MDLAASVGGAAAATIAGVIGLVAAANKRRSQRASTRDSVVFSDRSSRPTIDDPAPAQTTMVATTSWPPLRDGQLVALWYDERLVHATNAPRGAVASLSEYECGGKRMGMGSAVAAHAWRRGMHACMHVYPQLASSPRPHNSPMHTSCRRRRVPRQRRIPGQPSRPVLDDATHLGAVSQTAAAVKGSYGPWVLSTRGIYSGFLDPQHRRWSVPTSLTQRLRPFCSAPQCPRARSGSDQGFQCPAGGRTVPALGLSPTMVPHWRRCAHKHQGTRPGGRKRGG